MQVERLAFDIAAGDLAAIITCDRFGDLPESLRRHTDLVLRLPPMDVADLRDAVRASYRPAAPTRSWQRAGPLGQVPAAHRLRASPPHAAAATQALEFIQPRSPDRLRPSIRDAGWPRGAVRPGRGPPVRGGPDRRHPRGHRWPAAVVAGRPRRAPGRGPRHRQDDAGPRDRQGLRRQVHPGQRRDLDGRGRVAGTAHRRPSAGPSTEARDYAPSILFIDEIDSIGNREQFAGDNNSIYQTEVINAVLEQMQGLDPAAPVFVIGATNHEERVDPALRRSGRLDRVIRIPRPNSGALDHIYRHYIGRAGDRRGRSVRTSTRGPRSAFGRPDRRRCRAHRAWGRAPRAQGAAAPLAQTDVIAEITNKPRGLRDRRA